MDKEMLKSSMTNGAIIGAALIVYSLILYLVGINEFNPNREFSIFSIVPYIIIITGIVWGQIFYRDKVLNGNITYGRSLGYGVMLGVFFAILQTFYLIIFMKFIDTDVLQYIFDITEQSMIDQGLSTADIDKSMVMVKKMTFPMMMIGGIVGNAFMALIISLISSAFIKKESDPFSQDMKNIE
jgi:hypothetical protein